jgi:hypothetical protein
VLGTERPYRGSFLISLPPVPERVTNARLLAFLAFAAIKNEKNLRDQYKQLCMYQIKHRRHQRAPQMNEW